MMRTFSITTLPRGKKVEFLFVRHALNSKVCMHGIAIKQLEFRNGFDVTG